MMKKSLILLLALALVLGLAACVSKEPAQTTGVQTEPTTEATESTTAPTEPTSGAVAEVFPEDVRFGSLELGGMRPEEGLQALTAAAADYSLVLTVNGNDVAISSEQISLAVDADAYARYAQAMLSGAEEPADVFTYDRDALCELLKGSLNTEGKNAGIAYNSSKKKFTVRSETNGTDYDVDAAADAAVVALAQLLPAADVQVTTTKVVPEITAGSAKIQSALATANGYLGVSLTYTYTPDGEQTATEKISTDQVASFVSVSESLNVGISKSAIESYVSTVSSRHYAGDYKGSFRTTGGETIGYQVTYYGEMVNQSALTEDIYKCVTEGISGTRTAPYKEPNGMAYGGNYVEINLSAQHVWVYRHGECVVSTDMVSGSVDKEYYTPRGVYSIYAKQTDEYLVGANYRSYVYYWMPFYGGYGLHDATWRSAFGGDIYLYSGSHGCINLPYSAAGQVYRNVEVGTKVILYGGVTKADPLQQEITGTTVYNVADDCEPFVLDTKLKYDGAEVQYHSSDPSVVSISSDGTMQVLGAGTATITVRALAFSFYSDAEMTVEIVVHSACEEGRHSFSEDDPYCGKGCGTPNPDYTPPTEETEPPTEETEPPTEETEPPTEETEPPTEETEPPTEETEPPTEETEPPTEETEPPTEETEPPTEETEPPTEETEPPTEETEP